MESCAMRSFGEAEIERRLCLPTHPYRPAISAATLHPLVRGQACADLRSVGLLGWLCGR